MTSGGSGTRQVHDDFHKCEHECDCFWCRVSRREPMEPITDTMNVGGDGQVTEDHG